METKMLLLRLVIKGCLCCSQTSLCRHSLIRWAVNHSKRVLPTALSPTFSAHIFQSRAFPAKPSQLFMNQRILTAATADSHKGGSQVYPPGRFPSPSPSFMRLPCLSHMHLCGSRRTGGHICKPVLDGLFFDQLITQNTPGSP